MPLIPRPAVHTAQRTFRALLDAMARPGEIFQLALAPDDSPVFAVCAALLDFEVTYACAADTVAATALDQRIALEIGCPPSSLAEAAFIVSYGALPASTWEVVRRGTLAYPDRGATIIYIVSSVGPDAEGGDATVLTLTGPGIETERYLIVHGLAVTEFALLAKANSDYPMGIDAILIDPRGRVACLPRSSRIVAHDAGTEGT